MKVSYTFTTPFDLYKFLNYSRLLLCSTIEEIDSEEQPKIFMMINSLNSFEIQFRQYVDEGCYDNDTHSDDEVIEVCKDYCISCLIDSEKDIVVAISDNTLFRMLSGLDPFAHKEHNDMVLYRPSVLYNQYTGCPFVIILKSVNLGNPEFELYYYNSNTDSLETEPESCENSTVYTPFGYSLFSTEYSSNIDAAESIASKYYKTGSANMYANMFINNDHDEAMNKAKEMLKFALKCKHDGDQSPNVINIDDFENPGDKALFIMPDKM